MSLNRARRQNLCSHDDSYRWSDWSSDYNYRNPHVAFRWFLDSCTFGSLSLGRHSNHQHTCRQNILALIRCLNVSFEDSTFHSSSHPYCLCIQDTHQSPGHTRLLYHRIRISCNLEIPSTPSDSFRISNQKNSRCRDIGLYFDRKSCFSIRTSDSCMLKWKII